MIDTPRTCVPISVWELLLVRVGHWILVAAFAVAYVTRERDDLLGVHAATGRATSSGSSSSFVSSSSSWGAARRRSSVTTPAGAVHGFRARPRQSPDTYVIRVSFLFRARVGISAIARAGSMVIAAPPRFLWRRPSGRVSSSTPKSTRPHLVPVPWPQARRPRLPSFFLQLAPGSRRREATAREEADGGGENA